MHVPERSPWLAQYLAELTAFPNGKHDDQVDSTAQMLDWFKLGSGPRSDAGIHQLYKELAERPHAARPEPLSLMAKRLGLLPR